MTPEHLIEELYERESARIVAMCRAILGDRGDAEDAMQETFARVAARLDRLHGDPAAYLVVVARNVCRDDLRRHRRALATRHELPPSWAPDDVAVDRSLLRLAWCHLSRAERSVVAGVAAGFSLGEVGRRSGVSADVVAQRLSRARRRIRRLVAAPALVVGPLLAASGRSLRRLGSLPADVAGALARQGHQSEPWGALVVGVVAGMLAGPVSGPPALATPDAITHTPALAGPSPPLAVLAQRGSTLPGHPVALAVPTAAPHASPATTLSAPSGSVFDGTRVTSFTPSPNYTQDHTVFAAGTCVAPGCSQLFRSSDGGHSWMSLGGAGLPAGGRVLLTPDYPHDPELFAAASGSGLLRSTDGGATFTAVTAPINGDAVMDPSSPVGDPHIVVQLQPGTAIAVYRDSDRSLTTVTGLPPDVEAITAMFSAPHAGAVYVAVVEAVGGGSLYACASATACTRAGPGITGTPVLSPTFPIDRTLFTVQTNAVAIARVDGSGARTVSTGDAAAIAAIPAADYATSGRLDLVVRRSVNSADPLAMLSYVLSTATATAVSATFSTAMDLATVLRLPDGRILVAVSLGNQHFGVRCSPDDGATFAAIC